MGDWIPTDWLIAAGWIALALLGLLIILILWLVGGYILGNIAFRRRGITKAIELADEWPHLKAAQTEEIQRVEHRAGEALAKYRREVDARITALEQRWEQPTTDEKDEAR